MVVVVLAPLPLGSNREWSWSLCALVVSVLALVWSFAAFVRRGTYSRLRHPDMVILFLLCCVWIALQSTSWTPDLWNHPLWAMSSDALGIELTGSISLAADDSWTALMRLLTYALVFVLAYQLGRSRKRAQTAFGWLAIAGLIYAAAGLYSYWSGYQPEWLFGSKDLPHHVRSTFVNRNHFATWQGLILLCTLSYFYQRLSQPAVKPYEVPQDREARAEEFIMRAWKPMITVLVMITALLLTHSRGGFLSAVAGIVCLLVLLDRRVPGRKAIFRAAVVATLVVATIAFYLSSEVLLDRLDRTDIGSEERFAVFANVEDGISDNPMLGFGYGTFADSFRLYDRTGLPVHFDRAHNTWLENVFELGFPASLALYLAVIGMVWACLRGVRRRHRDWAFPATGVAASVLVGLQATVEFSLQIPAVAILYACIMGVAVAQSKSSSGAYY